MTGGPLTAFERVIDALGERGSKVTLRGDQAYAQCPAHKDRDPSLSVTRSEDRVLVTCHAGCNVDAVLDALNLNRRDLFDAPEDRQGRSVVVAEYPYVDQSGTVLHGKTRWEPKGFRQFRPAPGGKRIWNLDGVQPVLYRLPDVLDAIGRNRLVYLAEGEKDADALARAGVCATTWTEGAWKPGQTPKWRQAYTDTLRGADVVIVQDRDAAGENTARDIAAALQGVAASVQIVQAAEGKDAADHLAAGHNMGDFLPASTSETAVIDAEQAEWLAETPRPLMARPVAKMPAFPLHCLPDELAQHVQAVADASLTPVDFAAVACLGVLSTACAGRVKVRINRGFVQPLNLYLVPIAGPGEGKTPAFSPFMSLLFDHQTQLRDGKRDERAQEMARYEAAQETVEAARAALKKAAASATNKPNDDRTADLNGVEKTLRESLIAAEDTPKPVPPTIVITGNATPEALVKIMAENDGRLAIMATEGRIVDIISGQYGNKVDVTTFLTAYDGDEPLDGARVGRTVPDVPNPSLVICVAVQPVVWIEAMQNRQLRDRGLIARALACFPESLVGRRDRPITEVPERVEAPALRTMSALLDAADAHRGTELGLSRSAYALFEQYRRELDRRMREGHDLHRVAAWALKHHTRAVRLAGLLHLAGDPERAWIEPISGETFIKAREIADYFTAHQLALLDAAEEDESTGDDSPPAYLLRFLSRRDPQPGGWTLRELSRSVSKSRFPGGESDLRGALEVLSDYGWVWTWTPEKTTQGGRPPSLRIQTHPAMHRLPVNPSAKPADVADVADNGVSPAETMSASRADIAPVLADIGLLDQADVGNVGNVENGTDNQSRSSQPTVGKVGKVNGQAEAAKEGRPCVVCREAIGSDRDAYGLTTCSKHRLTEGAAS